MCFSCLAAVARASWCCVGACGHLAARRRARRTNERRPPPPHCGKKQRGRDGEGGCVGGSKKYVGVDIPGLKVREPQEQGGSG